jgi:hypothetical protein
MRAMSQLIIATIAIGLAVDQWGGAHGQFIANVAVWLLFLRLWLLSGSPQRPALLACLLIATAGEVFLSLVWGLYDYRLGNIPLFVPPGHVLLYYLGTQAALRLRDGAEWWIAAAALPVVAALAWTGRDTLGVILFAMFLACMTWSSSRKLYASMFLLSLVLELWGTWLGNWAWRHEVPWLGLVTANPPLAAGTFYCVLDLLVVNAAAAWQRQPLAIPIPTPSTPSHQAATCSARSSSR